MRIKTKILGVKAMVPSRIVDQVKIFKKKKKALDSCILLPLLENNSRLTCKMMLLLIEVTTQSFNSLPSTNS